jgi:hypothetical protein
MMKPVPGLTRAMDRCQSTTATTNTTNLGTLSNLLFSERSSGSNTTTRQVVGSF